MYLLKLALRPWRLALMSQLFSSIAVGFLLVLMGFLFWMQHGLKSVVSRLQGEQVLTAYLDSSVSTVDEQTLISSVRTALDSPSHEMKLVEIKLVNAPQFLTSIKSRYPDLVRELEGLGQEMHQVIPRYISISGMLSRSAVESVKSISGIESVESSKDRYHHIVGAFSTLRWVARILMGGLCFALLTGLIHLSRMNSYLHDDTLVLLKFWGAGTWTLMGPGTISGLLVGILGGAIASCGWITGGAWLAQHIRSLSALLKWMPTLNLHFALALFGVGGVIGLLAGLLGTFPGQARSVGRGSEA